MGWIVSGVLSSLLFGGMIAMIGALVASRWSMLANILAADSPLSQWDDRRVLPLRFAA